MQITFKWNKWHGMNIHLFRSGHDGLKHLLNKTGNKEIYIEPDMKYTCRENLHFLKCLEELYYLRMIIFLQ